MNPYMVYEPQTLLGFISSLRGAAPRAAMLRVCKISGQEVLKMRMEEIWPDRFRVYRDLGVRV